MKNKGHAVLDGYNEMLLEWYELIHTYLMSIYQSDKEDDFCMQESMVNEGEP
jgi:molybdenum-dependent DNA-binding transcriptional regulator ModE